MAEPQVGPENQAISAELQEIIEGTGIMQPNVNQNNQANKVNPSLGSEDKQELKENKPEVKDENKFEGTGSKPNAENGTVPNVVKPKRTKSQYVIGTVLEGRTLFSGKLQLVDSITRLADNSCLSAGKVVEGHTVEGKVFIVAVGFTKKRQAKSPCCLLAVADCLNLVHVRLLDALRISDTIVECETEFIKATKLEDIVCSTKLKLTEVVRRSQRQASKKKAQKVAQEAQAAAEKEKAASSSEKVPLSHKLDKSTPTRKTPPKAKRKKRIVEEGEEEEEEEEEEEVAQRKKRQCIKSAVPANLDPKVDTIENSNLILALLRSQADACNEDRIFRQKQYEQECHHRAQELKKWEMERKDRLDAVEREKLVMEKQEKATDGQQIGHV